MKWTLRECKFSDIIRVQINGIYHYGIFVNDDKVIQFGLPPIKANENSNNRDKVCVTCIESFACGKVVECGDYSLIERIKKFDDERIVLNAEKRIGEGGYDIVNNNCEHFVNDCVFGIKRSKQIEDIKKKWGSIK